MKLFIESLQLLLGATASSRNSSLKTSICRGIRQKYAAVCEELVKALLSEELLFYGGLLAGFLGPGKEDVSYLV